jgi:hypothetical protein
MFETNGTDEGIIFCGGGGGTTFAGDDSVIKLVGAGGFVMFPGIGKDGTMFANGGGIMFANDGCSAGVIIFSGCDSIFTFYKNMNQSFSFVNKSYGSNLLLIK